MLSRNVARAHGEPGQWRSSYERAEVDARGELRFDLASMLDAFCSRANMQPTSLGALAPVAAHRRFRAPSARRHNSTSQPVSQSRYNGRAAHDGQRSQRDVSVALERPLNRITLYAHKVLEMSPGAFPQHGGGCSAAGGSPVITGDQTVQRGQTLGTFETFARPSFEHATRSARGLANWNASATSRASSSRGA